VTSTFRVLYVLVTIEHHSRRLIHFNVTAHPTAQWTRQQLREAVGYKERYEYLLHDRDAIFSAELDESIRRLGLQVLKSPPRSPKANSICERVIGTIRRECLDWLIPLSETHLRQTLKWWVAHYDLTSFARCTPKQYLADCTTSTRLRACEQNRPSRERSDEVIAEDRGHRP
jgi:putative transposase